MPFPDADSDSESRPSWKEMMVTVAGLVLLLLLWNFGRARASVVLVTPNNETVAFPDTEASFAPRVPGAGLLGIVTEANPLDACEPLISGPANVSPSKIALVVRGMCTFQTKVRNAQAAGFAAAIVYDNDDNEDLITMSGDSSGTQIPAVFISKEAGEIIRHFTAENGTRCYILPVYDNTAWSVMAASFVSLFAIIVVLSVFFVFRRNRLLQLGSRLGLTREPITMTSKEVKALPTCIFKCISNGNATSETCAICLEDYEAGEKLRILPCHHEFHTKCIDQWLTTRRPFCPICKRDAHSKFQELPPSENTPLLAAASGERGQVAPENREVAQAASTGVLPEANNENIDELFIALPTGLLHEVDTQAFLSHRSPLGSMVRSCTEVHRQISNRHASHTGSPSKVHHRSASSQDFVCTSSEEVHAGERALEFHDDTCSVPLKTTTHRLCGLCPSCSNTPSFPHVCCSPDEALSQVVISSSFVEATSNLNSSPQGHFWDHDLSQPGSNNLHDDTSIPERSARSSCLCYIRSSSLDQFPDLSSQSTAATSDGTNLC